MITNEHLQTIDEAFSADVLAELREQYGRNCQRPSDAVCEALARVYGRTSSEIQSYFEPNAIDYAEISNVDN